MSATLPFFSLDMLVADRTSWFCSSQCKDRYHLITLETPYQESSQETNILRFAYQCVEFHSLFRFARYAKELPFVNQAISAREEVLRSRHTALAGMLG